jgi:hypothetical protein
MAMYIPEIGKTIRQKVTVFTYMLMVQSTKATGNMTSNRATVSRDGLMVPYTRANIRMDRRTAKAS